MGHHNLTIPNKLPTYPHPIRTPSSAPEIPSRNQCRWFNHPRLSLEDHCTHTVASISIDTCRNSTATCHNSRYSEPGLPKGQGQSLPWNRTRVAGVFDEPPRPVPRSADDDTFTESPYSQRCVHEAQLRLGGERCLVE